MCAVCVYIYVCVLLLLLFFSLYFISSFIHSFDGLHFCLAVTRHIPLTILPVIFYSFFSTNFFFFLFLSRLRRYFSDAILFSLIYCVRSLRHQYCCRHMEFIKCDYNMKFNLKMIERHVIVFSLVIHTLQITINVTNVLVLNEKKIQTIEWIFNELRRLFSKCVLCTYVLSCMDLWWLAWLRCKC